jgi:hypothetical protein
MTDDKYILSRAIRRVHPSVTRRAGALPLPTLPKCKLAIPLWNHSDPPLAVGRNSNQQSVCSLRAVIVARHPAAAGCLATIIQSLRDKEAYSFALWSKSFSGLHRLSVICDDSPLFRVITRLLSRRVDPGFTAGRLVSLTSNDHWR